MGFRELYRALQEYSGEEVVRDVLVPHAEDARTELMTLAWCKSFNRSAPAAISEEASWSWYALSRLYDWLILDTQRNLPGAASRGTRPLHATSSARRRAVHADDHRWQGPHVDMDGVSAFLSDLGFWQVADMESGYRAAQRRFHPFFHEIVDLVEDPNAAICSLTDVIWPGWMWGDMLFARAGVAVRCPPGLFRRELAVDSTLYFAYWRLHRPTHDLSHGWGSNSQWRTGFRRDYALSDAFLYNVGGRRSIDGGEPQDEDEQERSDGLTTPARIELLRHRSLVVSNEQPHDELFPFDDRYVEPRAGARTA